MDLLRRKKDRGRKNSGENNGSGTPDGRDVNMNINDSEYAKKKRELNHLIKTLKDLGAQNHLELPRMAVIGSQSAGKSSLVEAISGINVPRDSGTCTRCPMECTMNSTDGPWSCQISLRIDYDEKGKKQASPQFSKFGPVITEKKDVELWLRRAQAAILSLKTFSTFYDWSRERIRDAIKNDASMVAFSKNVICVDIDDPEGIDLSFIDLPGLIQNGEGIGLIQDLVKKYIAEEMTLILVTIPAGDDIQNQQALKLADEADPEGERTLAVLTKPDTLGSGDIGAKERWKKVLQGEAEDYPLDLGYFCVRLPNDQERQRATTRAEAQEKARHFFDTETPWKDITDRSRLGLPGLVRTISDLLMEYIEEGLPNIKQELEKRLAEKSGELAKLPRPLAIVDPAIEILDRITKFCSDLTATVEGNSQDKSFVQKNRKKYHWYKRAIRSTAPDFRPFVDHTMYPRPLDPDAEELGDVIVVVDNVEPYKTMNLMDVRRVIEQNKAWELPFNIPYAAKKALIKDFVDLWRSPTEACFERVGNNLSATASNLLTRHFGRFKGLEACIREDVFEQLKETKKDAVKFVIDSLESEDTPFYTDNTHYLSTTRDKWLDHYRARKRERDNTLPTTFTSSTLSATEQQALQLLRQLGYSVHKREDMQRRLPPDRYEDEMIVMADVRAYFQVVYKRVIDFVPLNIEKKLNRTVAYGMQRYLLEKTGIVSGDFRSSEGLRELLNEDPAVVKEREDLEKEVDLLNRIQSMLNEFKYEKTERTKRAHPRRVKVYEVPQAPGQESPAISSRSMPYEATTEETSDELEAVERPISYAISAAPVRSVPHPAHRYALQTSLG